MPNSPDHRFG